MVYDPLQKTCSDQLSEMVYEKPGEWEPDSYGIHFHVGTEFMNFDESRKYCQSFGPFSRLYVPRTEFENIAFFDLIKSKNVSSTRAWLGLQRVNGSKIGSYLFRLN